MPADLHLEQFKQAAAEAAAALVQDGMVVGLGTGSTARYAVSAIGRRIKEGLRIAGIPTSERTVAQARELGIPLTTLGENPRIDITIDGADEIETGTLHLIKGLGGALTREKIVAAATERLIIVADETKVVVALCSRQPVPVEVIAFGWQSTANRLHALGTQPQIRLGPDGRPYVTDGGNFILDCRFERTCPVAELACGLDRTIGVVEHGMFVSMAAQAFVAGAAGVLVLDRN